jgi:hypothetical protein
MFGAAGSPAFRIQFDVIAMFGIPNAARIIARPISTDEAERSYNRVEGAHSENQIVERHQIKDLAADPLLRGSVSLRP